MMPNNDGQGAMALIQQLEGKVRKYKRERDGIWIRGFNWGALAGASLISCMWVIVLKSLGKI